MGNGKKIAGLVLGILGVVSAFVGFGIPVLAMHSPAEIIDKRDLFNTVKLYRKFLKKL